MPAVSNRSRRRASFTRRLIRAGSPSSSATSIYSKDRWSRARRTAWLFRQKTPERSWARGPPQPITKTIVAVAIRPEKVKLSRRGPVADAVNAHALNRLEGVVTDVGYLGGLTNYKVKLENRAG